MANIGSKGILRHIDDPSVTVIAAAATTGVTWSSDADSGDTDFLRAVEAGKGLHYKGVLAATDDNMIEFASNNLLFAGQEGHAMVEVLLQFSGITNLAFNFGFNDDVEEDTGLPAELSSAGAWTSNASTFIGITWDTDYTTNNNLHCFWVDGDADTATSLADLRMTGITPTAAKWLYMKVELQDRGSGSGVRATLLAVDHNGRSFERVFNTSITRSTPLCWYFAAENRGDTGRNIFLRSCNWEQSIHNM